MTLGSCKVKKEDKVGAGPQKIRQNDVKSFFFFGCSLICIRFALCRLPGEQIRRAEVTSEQHQVQRLSHYQSYLRSLN